MTGIEIIAIILILMFSVIIHETAHGWAAYSLGDPTAKLAGRLTLNPIAHLDPVGSIILPLFLVFLSKITGGAAIIFGWAKPVPVNPYNFKDKKYGELKVSAAGPLSNIMLAIIFGTLIRYGSSFLNEQALFLAAYVVWINLILAVFNLIPIPPLDGSHILFSLLPSSANKIKFVLSQYGMIFVLILIFFFSPVIFYIVRFLFQIITGIGFNL